MTEATLFVADHAAHLATVVRPALAEGKIVISDRLSDSRFAYQSVTLQGIIPDRRGCGPCTTAGRSFRTDISLRTAVDDALTRLKPDNQREHFEKRETLEKVQNNYLAFARAEPSRFVVVDAMLPPDTVAQFVADANPAGTEIREEEAKEEVSR